ncbi:hypothetical protein AB0465_17205 [Streptomyces griseoviridis]|uniref:LPXTG cell wall anchor domain-containing protein n=1 Tax=Streptomyces hintoniae TaxID=3075521 RepID=A0ABU2UDH6_9ACTN|nr:MULTISPECIES: hypothetical protein [Streptomyces]MDH6699859.1 type II secretory pathway pseudopilin PulG [Streptomyces sp. MAA16]MDT0471046.1 hypothetical protein [Streptomyces sp. DSM 41014]
MYGTMNTGSVVAIVLVVALIAAGVTAVVGRYRKAAREDAPSDE